MTPAEQVVVEAFERRRSLTDTAIAVGLSWKRVMQIVVTQA